jgi:type VI secretion system protein ImpM
MGGHSAGDVASKTVIEALGTLISTGNLESYTACTTECLRTVNANLLEMAADLGKGRIIGSTVVVMLAVGWRCAAIWAGDSRLYQYRDGKLTQITNDHSLITELTQQGITSADTPDAEKAANIVTRAIGVDPELSFDVVTFDAETNDLYMLCSDGLVKEVKDSEIEDILRQEECQDSARDLIELALQRGARDNVTVVVARASQTGSSGV